VWKIWGGLVKVDVKPYVSGRISIFACKSIEGILQAPVENRFAERDGWFIGGDAVVGAGVELKPQAGVFDEDQVSVGVYGKIQVGYQWSILTGKFWTYASGDVGAEVKARFGDLWEIKRSWQLGTGLTWGNGAIGVDTPE
jgi:hypothetical protein